MIIERLCKLFYDDSISGTIKPLFEFSILVIENTETCFPLKNVGKGVPLKNVGPTPKKCQRASWGSTKPETMTKSRDRKMKARKNTKQRKGPRCDYWKMRKKMAIAQHRLDVYFMEEPYDHEESDSEEDSPVDEWEDFPLAWSIFNYVFIE